MGVTQPEDLSTNPCVQRGIAFEDVARQGFEERHDTLLLPLCAESTKHPVLRASLDGLSDDGLPVELKVPTEKTYQFVKTEGEEATAFRIAWVQLQHQLYVTDAGHGWLVFDPCREGMPALEFPIGVEKQGRIGKVTFREQLPSSDNDVDPVLLCCFSKLCAFLSGNGNPAQTIFGEDHQAGAVPGGFFNVGQYRAQHVDLLTGRNGLVVATELDGGNFNPRRTFLSQECAADEKQE